ncbi:MAG TPA: hypothetical protein VHG70_04755 [Nocardioidaceae bacterium]|nr:hypothetical protein [Nocardioidaceae bacterium]
MSLWSRIRAALGGADSTTPGEADAPAGPGTARSRATGGVPDPGASDAHSTTGTTPNETFVGRPAGNDPGDAETTGAEVRAEGDAGHGSDGALRDRER